MAGLPRSIIKKYGVSKKAWSVFRGMKTITPVKRGLKMARRTRRMSFKRFGRKAKRYAKNSASGSALI